MTELTSTQEVFWIIFFKINPGREADFRGITARLIESTRQEAGALNYEWSINPEGTASHVYERYTDSAAVKIHGQRNGALVGQLLETATVEKFVIYGAPDAEVLQDLAGLNAIFLKPLGGFAR